MRVRLKQLAQDGATDGQGLVYNAASGLWLPADLAAGGGGPDQETNLTDNTRSDIGLGWDTGPSLSITTAGVYELEITGVVASDSASTGAIQLRLLRGSVPLSGYGLDRNADGIFLDHRPSVAWGPVPFTARLKVYSNGSDTFTVEYRNSDASTYTALGSAKIRAYRVGDLDAPDTITTRTMRMHVDRANYAFSSAGQLDWWSDAMTGYRWIDDDGSNTHGGGVFNAGGWTTGVDTCTIAASSGGFVGNVATHSSTNHCVGFLFEPSTATGSFQNLLRITPAGAELGCFQSHTGDELAYIYGHSGTPQLLGVAGTTAQQFLVFVFDKTGADEVRVYRNGVEIASDSLTGQTGQTWSSTNQGWLCFPTTQGFAHPCELREVFAFSNALDTVTADWDALHDYIAAEYSIDDRP